jgi:hypothetical protein
MNKLYLNYLSQKRGAS